MSSAMPSVSSMSHLLVKVLLVSVLAELQGSACQNVFPSSQLQSRDCRFCIVDPECWGLKLETLMKMFGCNMPA